MQTQIFNPIDPEFENRVRNIFNAAPFVNDLNIVLESLGPGWIQTGLTVQPKLLQQNGLIHAGVQATIADHSAGAAAGTLCRADQIVLTAEFKINLLRPAKGERLLCRAEVLKPGKQLSIVEMWVYAILGNDSNLTSKATATIALVEANHLK